MKNRLIFLLFMFFFMGLYIAEGAEKEYIKQRLAVISFETKNVDEATVQSITELTQSLLENAGLYSLVERGQILKIYEEQKLQNTGLVDESTAISIGKMLGARKLVLGSINQVDKQILLTARIVDVETGIIEISGSKTSRSLLDIREAAGDLVKILIEHDRREYELYAPSNYIRKGAIGIGIIYMSPLISVPASRQTINETTIEQGKIGVCQAKCVNKSFF